MTCTKGLHDCGPGRCRRCQADYLKAYRRTEAGKEANRRSSSNYHFKMSALAYGAKLLRNRRYKALKRQEQRRIGGKVSSEGRD